VPTVWLGSEGGGGAVGSRCRRAKQQPASGIHDRGGNTHTHRVAWTAGTGWYGWFRVPVWQAALQVGLVAAGIIPAPTEWLGSGYGDGAAGSGCRHAKWPHRVGFTIAGAMPAPTRWLGSIERGGAADFEFQCASISPDTVGGLCGCESNPHTHWMAWQQGRGCLRQGVY
jgi:hypothetical protein